MALPSAQRRADAFPQIRSPIYRLGRVVTRSRSRYRELCRGSALGLRPLVVSHVCILYKWGQLTGRSLQSRMLEGEQAVSSAPSSEIIPWVRPVEGYLTLRYFSLEHPRKPSSL